ncbi:hypothetical protein JCM8097_004678, partial [Rhodosporidiobolus ruineniae]
SSKLSSSSGAGGQVSRDPLLSPAFIDHLHLRLADLTASVLADPSTASSLHTYLASVPSSSLPATPALAYLLAALRFPPLSTLQQLRSLVASAVEQQQLGKGEVAVLLRLVGKKVAEEQAGGDKKVVALVFLYSVYLAFGTTNYGGGGQGGWGSVNVRLFTVLDQDGRILDPGWSIVRLGKRIQPRAVRAL